MHTLAQTIFDTPNTLLPTKLVILINYNADALTHIQNYAECLLAIVD